MKFLSLGIVLTHDQQCYLLIVLSFIVLVALIVSNERAISRRNKADASVRLEAECHAARQSRGR